MRECLALARAGFVSRILAGLIDVIILAGLWWLVIVHFGISFFSLSRQAGDVAALSYNSAAVTGAADMPIWAKNFFLTAVVIYLIYTSTEVFLCGTPGKLLLGLRIAHEDGQEASLLKLLVRWTFKQSGFWLYAASVFLAAGVLYTLSCGAGFIIAVGCLLAINLSRQTLHDRISATAVYPVEELTSTPRFSGLSVSRPPLRKDADPNDLFKPRW